MTIDQSIVLFFNVGLANPLLDKSMQILTNFGSLIFWTIIVFVLLLKKEKKPALMLGFSMIVNTLLLLFLKIYIAKPRPFQTISGIRALEHPRTSSFPSAHASQTALSATILSKYYPKISIFLWFLVLLVSFSRIYLGVHYPTDVLFGIVEGIAIGLFFLRYFPIKKVERKLTKFWRKYIKI